ncbi:MAG: class I SAM-dependent methyltransferase, partial [Jatrophihabitantaceae bacterium]
MTTDLPGSRFARSFGAEAVRYAQVRPTYPVESIDFVLANHQQPEQILDLGAGTGKLTQLLVGRAEEVIAVEPDASMREQLAAHVPAATALAGSAERIPLPDASVDAVLVGQAFHWFARPAADRELARVLRPGGVLGLIWNFSDRSAAWVSGLYEAMRDPDPPTSNSAAENLDPSLFGELAEHWTHWTYELAGADALRDLMHTWS